jgi:hypothetical protein
LHPGDWPCETAVLHALLMHEHAELMHEMASGVHMEA